ncbi:MAG TPA: response regulator [Solirubrobacteraceae bacterium]|jgi:CheY-like chemotaxis protein
MARVAALIPDLLFGSKVQAALENAGHEVDLIAGDVEAWDEIAGVDVLVVDLTTDDTDGITLVETLAAGGELHGVRTLGFFAHVQPEVRERALAAGFDLVVPRSRMARESTELVSRLTAEESG